MLTLPMAMAGWLPRSGRGVEEDAGAPVPPGRARCCPGARGAARARAVLPRARAVLPRARAVLPRARAVLPRARAVPSPARAAPGAAAPWRRTPARAVPSPARAAPGGAAAWRRTPARAVPSPARAARSLRSGRAVLRWMSARVGLLLVRAAP
ncbi:hypothetical protein [Sorangium cellulosum]|uniref:hypothetical protein n=1 Tax=Sorangium cellulosum TaxID=56 RepID=UPI000676F5CE|nr:hypothetical protein [Sorangium cellulosum]